MEILIISTSEIEKSGVTWSHLFWGSYSYILPLTALVEQ